LRRGGSFSKRSPNPTAPSQNREGRAVSFA
jgi:hypothetical protein